MFIASHYAKSDDFSSGNTAPCTAQDCSVDAKRWPAICSQLTPSVAPYAFSTGDRLAPEDLPHHIMAFVALGAIRTEWILDNGRRQVLGFYFKGDALGGSCRYPGVRPIAVTSGILHLIKEKDLYRCQKWRPDSAGWQHSTTAESLDRQVALVMLLGQFTATEKIATFLYELSERIGIPRGDNIAVDLNMKRDDIADYLGLNTETVSRQLGRMRASGLLDLPKPGKLIIRDREKLRALSPFSADNPF